MTEIEHSEEFKMFIGNIERNASYALYTPYDPRTDLHSIKETSEITKEFVRLMQIVDKPSKGQSMQNFVHWHYETLLCRDIEEFQYYISRMLLKVFLLYPSLLKHSDPKDEDSEDKPDNKVEIREILEAGSIEEFIRRYADKKVTSLGYSGLPKIIKYLNSKLSLEFDTKMPAFPIVKEFVEVRNIIVHNAGRVNRLYRQLNSTTDLQEGDLYPLRKEGYMEAGVNALIEVAQELDYQIVAKYKLTNGN